MTLALNGQSPDGKRRRGPRVLAELVGPVLNPVIERRAGLNADLISMWSELAGEANAAFSRPEKLDWPRSVRQGGAEEPATLVIACDAARVLFVTHEADAIVARVNAYFGYRAVARIRLVQRPIAPPAPPRPVRRKPAPLAAETRAMIAEIEDEGLRDVLQRLGQGVFSHRSSRGR